jgi:hypothetical protein
MHYNEYLILIIVMCAGYFIIICFASCRLYTIQRFSKEWGACKWFFLSILFQSMTRLGTFLFMSFNFPVDRIEKDYFFAMITLPDFLFIVTYGLLVYRALTVFYYSHIETKQTLSILSRLSNTSNKAILKVIVPVLVLWMIYCGVMYGLLFYNKVSQMAIRLQVSLVNIVAGIIVLYAIIYFYSKYLLTPFKSASSQNKLFRFSKLLILFTIGRFYKGIIGLLEVDISSSLLIDVYQIHDSSIFAALILASTYLVSEILAFAFVLDYGFLYLFLFPEEEFLQYTGLYNVRSIASESDDTPSWLSFATSKRS